LVIVYFAPLSTLVYMRSSLLYLTVVFLPLKGDRSKTANKLQHLVECSYQQPVKITWKTAICSILYERFNSDRHSDWECGVDCCVVAAEARANK